VGIEVPATTVMVDNLTSPIDGLAIMMPRGYYMSHLTSGSSQTCNQAHHPSDDCDLDADSCAEFEENTSVSYDIDITFSFGDESATVPFSSTIITVPDEILNAMRTSSGNDSLLVTLSGNVVFSYLINDRTFDGFQCNDNIYYTTQSIPISIAQSFTVAGNEKLFFLRSPVLKEQWASNNNFDVIVFSQAPIYYAEILLDNNTSANFTLSTFSTVTVDYAIDKIVSTRLNASMVVDTFLGTAQYNETISSRTLSYAGMVDTQDAARPSISYPTSQLNNIQLTIGFIAIIVFLAFVHSWISD
jgi:hypothetical protein